MDLAAFVAERLLFLRFGLEDPEGWESQIRLLKFIFECIFSAVVVVFVKKMLDALFSTSRRLPGRTQWPNQTARQKPAAVSGVLFWDPRAFVLAGFGVPAAAPDHPALLLSAKKQT